MRGPREVHTNKGKERSFPKINIGLGTDEGELEKWREREKRVAVMAAVGDTTAGKKCNLGCVGCTLFTREGAAALLQQYLADWS